MNKRPEITEQTKANLLEAFWSLYAEKRIDRITVKEICAKAGYHRGTFYEYFSDVGQCLDRIEALALLGFEELPPMPDGRTPNEGLFESFVALYRKKYQYYDVLLGERGDPSFQRKLIECIKTSIMARVKHLGLIDPVELDFMLEYVLSGMIGVMRYFFHKHPRKKPSELMAVLHRSMSGDFLRQLRRIMA